MIFSSNREFWGILKQLKYILLEFYRVIYNPKIH
jgi:hypothetical protein